MNFSISALNAYRGCPKRYNWLYNEKRPVPEKSDHFYRIYGIVVQKVFEIFYNEKCWNLKDDMLPYLKKVCQETYKQEIQEKYVDWERHNISPMQFYQECEDAILLGLGIIKENRLIAPYVRSELYFSHVLNNADKLTGNLDFLYRFNENDVWILDGKGSSSKNANPNQLLFYGLLYYLNNNVIPTKLGFIYWRHGCVKYINFTKDDIEQEYVKTLNTIKQIKVSNWEATPPNDCFLCDYKVECDDYQQYIHEKRLIKLGGDPLFNQDLKGEIDIITL